MRTFAFDNRAAKQMKKLFQALSYTVLALCLAACAGKGGQYCRLEGFAQGGTWHIICARPEVVKAEQLQNLADSLLLEIDASISGYNKGSLLSRLNAGEDLPLDRHFIANFKRSKEIWEQSGGAFDPSAAPLFDLWGFGFTDDEKKISDTAIDSVMQFTGMDHFSLEEKADGTHLLRDDSRCKLNFNAIAQGYSCDCIAEALRGLGCNDYLVEVGREIVCKGLSPRGGKWNIALEKPVFGAEEGEEQIEETLELTDCGIVTSGNYRKFYVKDGRRYSHTIDPATGRPVTHNLLSATVITDDATTADAYATWMMVIGADSARAVADSLGFELYLIQ